MSKQKTRRALLPALLPALAVLAAASLSGCRFGKDVPVYQMETRGDYCEVLYIDGVQYQRDLSGDWEEQARYYSDGDQYVWTPAEGIGEQIGACGEGADKGGGFAVYEIAGDDNRTFLYTAPRKFYYGGVEARLWMREGVTLGAPGAETVASITVVSEKAESTSVQVDDMAMIASMLEAYGGDSVPPNGGDWVRCSLVMRHKDFPFLQYEVECRCSPEREAAYCQNKKGEWFILPAEWFVVISECGFPAGGT